METDADGLSASVVESRPTMRQALTYSARAVVLGLALLTTERPIVAACTPLPVASPQGNGGGQFVAVAGGGRYVAFGSYASDLVPGDTSANDFDVFRLDLQTCTVVRASTTSTGGEANARVYSPVISDDGRYIAFYTTADNVVAGDSNGAYDVFVRDLQAASTVRASVSSGGTEGNFHSTVPAISGNGQFVAFWSEASNLVANDTNGEMDVFVRDLLNATTTRVSVATGGTQASGALGGEGTEFFTPSLALSNDGRYVFFSSGKTNLVPGDTNGVRDIFRHDRQTGTTIRVSLQADGNQSLAQSFGPSASADGRYVSFTTDAALVPEDTNSNVDVYLRDIAQGVTTRASVAGQTGNLPAGAQNGSLSGDARYIAFESTEHRIVPGDTNNATDVFVHDRQTGITRRASRSAAGVQGNSNSTWPSLSEDGLVVGVLLKRLEPGAKHLHHTGRVRHDMAGTSAARADQLDCERGLLERPDVVVQLRPPCTDGRGGDRRYRGAAVLSEGGHPAGRRPAGGQRRRAAHRRADRCPVRSGQLGQRAQAHQRAPARQQLRRFAVCTFWLPANSPLTPYGISSHTTQHWTTRRFRSTRPAPTAPATPPGSTPRQRGGGLRADRREQQHDVSRPDRTGASGRRG